LEIREDIAKHYGIERLGDVHMEIERTIMSGLHIVENEHKPRNSNPPQAIIRKRAGRPAAKGAYSR